VSIKFKPVKGTTVKIDHFKQVMDYAEPIMLDTVDGKRCYLGGEMPGNYVLIRYIDETNRFCFQGGISSSKFAGRFKYTGEFMTVNDHLPEPSLEASSGYLAPDGRLWPCGWMEHGSISGPLAHKYGVREKSLHSSQRALEIAGFIKLQGDVFYDPALDSGCEATQRQIDAIFDWTVAKSGRRMPEWLHAE